MKLTFCFVWLPAPGHSVMISSLASVLVANANATPENVVPYVQAWCNQQSQGFRIGLTRAVTYKIYTDDELGLAAAALPLNFGDGGAAGTIVHAIVAILLR